MGCPKAGEKSMKWVTGSDREVHLMSVSWKVRQVWLVWASRQGKIWKKYGMYRTLPSRQSETLIHQISLHYSPLSGIRINLTQVISETQRAEFSSFLHFHNAAKDTGLHRGGAALLTSPAAPLRTSGLVVKRPLEKNCGWNTLACLCPVRWTGWTALTLALCQPDPVKPLNKSHSSVVLYMPNGWHSFSRVVL